MKLYWEILRLIFGKFVLRRSTGRVVKDLATSMGITYIKLAQILAMQNFGELFTEADRKDLASICDNCNPIEFQRIEAILRREYGERLAEIFESIDEEPIGAASVSQVHRARLKTGEEVVIKVKRADVARRVEKDIKQMKRLMHRFAWIVKFKNLMGGDHGLELYLSWILAETDFHHECKNIETYRGFINGIQGKLRGVARIRIPKLYKPYCTDNIIVMEYVKAPSINQIAMTTENKAKITEAINSFMSLSFYALLNGSEVIYHGDPHGGNLCVDENGDLWFIDLGLLCIINQEDAKICRELFLAAYTNNAEKLYRLLEPYGKLDGQAKQDFKADCQKFCREIRQKEVSYYFIDMLNICLYYEFVPPDFLFGMAKAFLCLNGINHLTDNDVMATELLQKQVMKFMLRRSVDDFGRIINTARKTAFSGVASFCHNPFRFWPEVLASGRMIREDVENLVDDFCEMVDLAGMGMARE